MSAKEGNVGTVRLLLNHAASIETARDVNGTALHAAAKGGSLEAVRVLVKHTANVNSVNRVNNCS